MATRTKPLTAKQGSILEVLGRGGRIVECIGVRGFMAHITLYEPGAELGVPVDRTVFRSLYNPHVNPLALYGPTTNPGLVEPFKPLHPEFHHVYYRITKAGRAALALV